MPGAQISVTLAEESLPQIKSAYSTLDALQLISQLHTSTSPPEIHAVDEVLRSLHRSSSAWRIAGELLMSTDTSVLFHAALMLTIKIYNDWTELTEEDVFMLIQTVLDWYCSPENLSNAPPRVIKKLCAVLSLLSVRFSQLWPYPLRHTLCFLSGSRFPLAQTQGYSATESLISRATLQTKLIVLWLSCSIAEELVRVRTERLPRLDYQVLMGNNSEDAIAIITESLTRSNQFQADEEVVKAGFSAMLDWLKVFEDSWDSCGSEQILRVRRMVGQVLPWIHGEYMTDAVDCAIELITVYPRLIGIQFLRDLGRLLTTEDSLAHPFIVPHKGQPATVNGEAEIELVLALCEAMVETIAVAPSDEINTGLLQLVHAFMKLPGHPGVDEDSSQKCLEFWTLYANTLSELQLGDNAKDEYAISTGVSHISIAVRSCWHKMKLPGQEVSTAWSNDDLERFKEYRRDSQDFMIAAHGLLHSRLLTDLVQNVLQSSWNQNWTDIEVSLQIINSLHEDITEDSSESGWLRLLLSSSLLSDLSNPLDWIMTKAASAAIELIGSYSEYYRYHRGLVLPSLDFLFICLWLPNCSHQAARAIVSLCSACRSDLHAQLPLLIKILEPTETVILDNYIESKLVQAVACIIQSMVPEREKQPPVEGFLRLLSTRLADATLHEPDRARATAASVLDLLASFGQGLQSPDECPSTNVLISRVAFWTSENGEKLQTLALDIVQKLSWMYPQDLDIMNGVVAVFETGFKEGESGLLVFPASITTKLLLDQAKNGHDAHIVLSVARKLLINFSCRKITEKASPEAEVLLRYLSSIIATEYSRDDPELIRAAIETFQVIATKYGEVVTRPENLHQSNLLFDLCADTLSVPESFTMRAAASFWTTYISASNRGQQHLTPFLTARGALLTKKIVEALSGRVARSDIETLTEPLRKLIFRQPLAATWLAIAFDNTESLSPKLSEADRTQFMSKLLLSRGGRETIQIAKELWVQSRGDDFRYIS